MRRALEAQIGRYRAAGTGLARAEEVFPGVRIVDLGDEIVGADLLVVDTFCRRFLGGRDLAGSGFDPEAAGEAAEQGVPDP